MTNLEVESWFAGLVDDERRTTAEMLKAIIEVESRRLYLEQGYPSAYDWMVKKFRYSHSAAHRRIQASRLLAEVPEVAPQLNAGEVNLTSLSQVQSAVRREERKTGKTVDRDVKLNLVQSLKDKTGDECAKILARTFPDSYRPPESLTVISETESRLKTVLDQETVDLLHLMKSFMSHTKPDASWGDVIKFTAQECVTRRMSAGATRSSVKRVVLKRAGFRCEYKDERTGTACESRFQLEVDHIVPKAMGGTDDLENLRCLCKQHNMMVAELKLGKRKMRKHWKRHG